MRYLSLFSGIEAASVAWDHLGWTPLGFAEIEPFPSAVLKAHYPDVPNFGDVTNFMEWPDVGPVDVICGGSPCQSFSVAGLRAGLDDPRGDLMFTYAATVRRYRPRWLAWENVPGVLSSNEGRDFGSLLGLLSGRRIQVPSGGWQNAGVVDGYEGAYGLAWAVIDAQFTRTPGFPRAVPQRRRRVWLIGCAGGDWRRAAAVLFERESLRGDPAPRRQAGQGVTGTIAGCSNGGGPNGPGRTADDADTLIAFDTAPALTASGRGVERTGESRGQDPIIATPLDGISATVSSKWSKQSGGPAGDEAYNLVAHTLRGEGFDAMEDGTGRGTPLVPVAPDVAMPPTAGMAASANRAPHEQGALVPVAFQPRFARNGRGAPDEVAAPLTTEAGRTGKGDSAQCVAFNWQNGGGYGAAHDGLGISDDHSPPLIKKQTPALAYPLDLRNATRDPEKHDREMNRQGVGVGEDGDPAPTLTEFVPGVAAMSIAENVRAEVRTNEVTDSLSAGGGKPGQGYAAAMVGHGSGWAVRRLTPRECERLQGFPDDHTLVTHRNKPAADGPRYKALGNSWAVNVARWVGLRIQEVDTIGGD